MGISRIQLKRVLRERMTNDNNENHLDLIKCIRNLWQQRRLPHLLLAVVD